MYMYYRYLSINLSIYPSIDISMYIYIYIVVYVIMYMVYMRSGQVANNKGGSRSTSRALSLQHCTFDRVPKLATHMGVSMNWGGPVLGPYLRDPIVSGPYEVPLILESLTVASNRGG